MKTKSNKLRKLENNRKSLFTDNKNKCMFCENIYDLTWHEIYAGKNRQNSMKYDLCLRMCVKCHKAFQENKAFNDYWHKQGQIKFEEIYSHEDFMNIFHENYL